MGVKRYELSDAQWSRIAMLLRARLAILAGLARTTGCL